MRGAIVTSSYQSRGRGGNRMRRFPPKWETLSAHNLVILANADARSISTLERALLEEFVTNGGSLLVCGGPFAFQRGGYRQTAFDRLLPCLTPGKNRLKAEGGLVMRPTEAAENVLPADLAWDMVPRVYYYHPAEPKPGARVFVTAADHPLLIGWEIGKGRVAALAASAEGDPPADQLAFWEWGDMPRLMAAVCQWLILPPRPETAWVISDEIREQLEQLLIPSPGNRGAKRQRELRMLLSRCRDLAFAQEILVTASLADRTPDRRFVEAAAAAVRPFAGKELAEDALALMDAGDAGKAALGIRVLGMCRSPRAGARIQRFLEEGIEALEQGDDDGFDMGGILAAGPDQGIIGNERIKLAAVLALGDLGDPAMVAPLRKVTAEFAKKRQGYTQINEQSDLNENVYQQSLASRCRLGDGTAAAPFLGAIVKNSVDIEAFQNALDIMLVNKNDKHLLHMRRLAGKRLPVLHRRQSLCLEMLARAPYALATDFARELARRGNPDLLPYAYAALTPNPSREPTTETARAMLSLLRESPVPELRLLAFRMAADRKDPETDRLVVSILVDLAGSPDVAVARFALRRAPQLGGEARAAVIEAARKHPDADVRRLATLSQRKPPGAK